MVELYWPRETTFLTPSGQYTQGVHDVPDDQEEAFRERGWEDPPEEEDEDGDETETDEIDDLLDGTIPEIEEALASGDYDDRLDEVEQREDAGEDRSGVQEAIDNRRDELEDEG